MTQKNLGIDVIINHVIGILNCYTDIINRGDPSVTLDTNPQKDFFTNAAAFACLQVSSTVKQVALKHFQPSPDFLLHIEYIILDKDTNNLPELCKSNSGQIVPGQIIIFDFAENNWSRTLA